MTTKEQERKALDQIKKIVAGLGENSYVGTAFAGCFEDAEQNIEYDAAYSSLGRAEAAEKKELESREKLVQVEGEMVSLKKRHEDLKADYERLGEKYDKVQGDTYQWNKAYNEAQARVNELEETVLEQGREITKLKAMLFDLMFKDKIAG